MRKIIIGLSLAIIGLSRPFPALAQPLVLNTGGDDAILLSDPPRHVATVHGSVQTLASRVQEHRAVGRHNAFPLPIPLPPMPPPLPSPTPAPAQNPVGDLATILSTIAIPDLQAALANANAQTPPDITSANCWAGLIPIAQQIQSQLPNPNGANPIGIAMTIQLARDLINAPTSPVLKQVNIACAAMYVDMKVGVLNFASQAAGIFATGAVLSPIKPIPIP